MLTNYFLWYTKKDDDVHFSEVGVIFFEGAEVVDKGKSVYRVTRSLTKEDISHIKCTKMAQRDDGKNVAIFTPQDFGVISDEGELRVFLNTQLALDATRTPAAHQTERDPLKLKRKNI